jgi:type IV pilus assembly protein PilM
MFGYRKSPLLGIDISSSVVKLLELSHKAGKYTVESFAIEILPLNAVMEGRIENKDEVTAAIKRVVKKSGTKLKEVAIAVSANSAITKVISFPAGLSEREMEEQITLEAENYIPYPLEDVMLDFEVIGPSESDPDAVDVLLAASTRENVLARTDVIEAAGLKPKLVDVEAYAIENAFSLIADQMPNFAQGLVVAIAEVGATLTTVHVVVDGKIVFTREQTFGGRVLTEEIERHYGLSYQEAGLAKKQNDLPEDYEPKVLEPFKRALVTTISRSLQFFFSASAQYQSIDHIIVSGGCASIDGIDKLIEEETGSPTSVANPFAEMDMSTKVKVKSLNDDSPSMLIASGLAMRSFD